LVNKNNKHGKHSKYFKKINTEKKINSNEQKHQKDSSIKSTNVSQKENNYTNYILYGIIGLLIIIGLFLLLISKFDLFKNNEINEKEKELEQGELLITINGDKIYSNEIENKLKGYQAQYGPTITKEFVINQTINERLLLQEAKKQNIVINELEIDNAVNQWLQSIKMSLSEEDINKLLAEEGYTLDSYLKELREQYVNNYLIYTLLNQTVFSKIDLKMPEIEITDEELLEIYNENKDDFMQRKVSHILICHDEALNCANNITKEEALEKINEIYDELKNGGNFAELAKEYSDCPSSQDGGNLRFISRNGEMIKEFEDAAFDKLRNVNQFTEPIETAFGYHIIKLTDKKETFDELKEEIKLQLTAMQQQQYEETIYMLQNQAIEKYIEELKNDAEIMIYKQTNINEKNVEPNQLKLKEFNDCLAQKGMIIYGTTTCPHCKNLVELLGGYDVVTSVYVECTQNQEKCINEMQGNGVPEIQINGEIYKGQRTIENLAKATNCPVPI
jgi:foldase protein PrsA